MPTQNDDPITTAVSPDVVGTVYAIPTSEIYPMPDSPYSVQDDAAMAELVESIKQFGILVPTEVRPKDGGGYAHRYSAVIGWIIVFKMYFSFCALSRIRGINLIPFYYDQETSFHLREVIMNVLAFIPLGVFLKLLKFDFKASVLWCLGYSFLLEIMQFVFKVGITDITDLITNTSGVVIGAAFYIVLSKIFKRTDTLDKVLTVLAAIGVVLLMALMLLLIIANT